MKHSLAFRSRVERSRRPHWYRPILESLERRLPPGDLLWTMLLGGSGLALGIDADKLENSGSALSIDEKPALIREIARQAPDANAPSEDIVTNEREKRQDDSTSDSVNQQIAPARTFSRPNTAAVNLTPDTGASFAALATPSQRNTLSPVTPGRVQLDAPYLANGPSVSQAPNLSTPSEAAQSEVLDNFGKLPLSFEQNVGQFDDPVDFVSRAGTGTVFLTPIAAVFAIQSSESRIQNSEAGMVLSEPRPLGSGLDVSPLADARGSENEAGGVAVYMNIMGGDPDARATASNQQPGITNYFIGNDPNEWHTSIASFGRVEYDDVYPGIDLAYYGNNNQLEYDFIVSPGADPNAIALNFAGADDVQVNPQGDLIVHTAVGDVVQQKPFTYQGVGNTRREVASAYVIQGDTIRFQVGNYDASLPLVIDPVVLGYSTFLGGSLDDVANGIAVDSSGNAYVTGSTSSSTFPTKPGSFDTTFNGISDVFVSKINGAGTGLMYSTFIGGSVNDAGYALTVDGGGNAYVTGTTSSTNFPVTGFSFDTSHNGSNDVFVVKLNPFGSGLDYSTFLGGSSSEAGTAIAINSNSEAFVTGVTHSANFPTTPGAFDTTFNSASGGDAFVTKVTLISFVFDLDYSTFLGGLDIDQATGIAIDASQNAYVSGYTNSGNFPTTTAAFDTVIGGYDAFVTKLNPFGSALAYSTYVGGTGSDFAGGIDIDVTGNAYITGDTSSGNFPVTSGACDTSQSGIYDAYVFKLNAAGSAPIYSTYLGGTQDESGYDIRVDAGGNAFVAGFTNSSNFPITPDAFDKTFNAFADGFVTRLNAAGSALVYSTFLGGLANEHASGIAVDDKGGIYVTGDTTSSNFPTSPTAFDTTYAAGGDYDAFVTKLHGIPAPCGCFNSHTISTAANGAFDVFAADIDRDGDIDGVSASYYDNKIAWYENIGNESFTARTITTAAMGATSVFAADIDGDGDTDVLSASQQDDKIAWYRNNGSQSFTPFTISSTANGAKSVYAADVDSDGDIDALSASFFDSKIAWYENNGTGNFTTRVISTAANGAVAVAAADLDSDGDIDVLSASNNDAKIAWYKNNGNQVFTAQTITTAAPSATSVAPADVNGDGYTDVLSASGGDNEIAWYENNGGSGVFTAHTITTTFVDHPTDVFAADINADGKTDVVSASYFDNQIAWFQNGGGSNPSFTPHTITTNANQARAVFAADVEGDGDLDVLSASFADDKIAWHENRNFHFEISAPASATAGTPFNLTVSILDQNQQQIVDYTGTVHFTSSDSQGILPADYTYTPADQGVHTFTATLKTAGSRTVTVTDTEGAVLNGEAVIQVTPAAASALTVAGFPSPIEAGVPGNFTVTAKDAFGNVATGYGGTVHFSTSAPHADLPPDSTLTNGTGAFTATLITPGVQSITATDTVNGTITGAQGSINVTPGYTVVTTADAGPGSFRQAILNANANPGPDVIDFNIGSGVQTIAPLSALPTITDPVTIDASTQGSFIVVSGANIPAAAGLHITAGNSTVKGMVINGFSTGIGIHLETGDGNLIKESYIGTNAAGTAAVPNGTGISIASDFNTIGGQTSAYAGVISGNGTGVLVTGDSNIIDINYIGVAPAGGGFLHIVPNTGNGVFISGSNNLVGFNTDVGPQNIIAYNGGAGVVVDTGTGNAIRPNNIYFNDGLGIDLINGGNNNQAKPSVNAATSGGGTTTISVSLVGAPTTTYTIDFFVSGSCDPSTFGEGELWLGSKTLTTKTTGRGRTVFVATAEYAGSPITATATSPGGDTSEFSKCKTVT